MPLHRLLSALASALFRHPQLGPRLVERLAESRPIRAAARAVAYAYLRSKQALEDRMGKGPDLRRLAEEGKRRTEGTVDVERFKRNLTEEIRKGMREATEKAKKDR